MKHKFKEFLENLSYGEVVDFQKQVKDSKSLMRKMVDDQIDVIERTNARVCATCGHQLNLQTKNLTMHFGPETFKKKASFCAFDCLEFFLTQLKAIEIKGEKNEKKTV